MTYNFFLLLFDKPPYIQTFFRNIVVVFLFQFLVNFLAKSWREQLRLFVIESQYITVKIRKSKIRERILQDFFIFRCKDASRDKLASWAIKYEGSGQLAAWGDILETFCPKVR